jgi:hypothetical protein
MEVTASELLAERTMPGSKSLLSLPEDKKNLAGLLRELGVPLMGSSRKGRSFSPEAVVLDVLRVIPSARMVECLPGLLFKKERDHEKLLRLPKERGLVNRLGFIVDAAVSLAERIGDRGKAARLRVLSKKLWNERRKEGEEFLMDEAPEGLEFRNWLNKKDTSRREKMGRLRRLQLEAFP